MEPLQIGVCSWSLRMPNIAQALAAVRHKLGLRLVQIGFWGEEFRDLDGIRKAVEENELEVSATCLGFEGEDYGTIQAIAETGGFKPDEHWEARFAKTKAFAEFTAAMNVRLLTVHVGFVPHDTADPQHGVMVERLKQVCDTLGEHGLTLVMETGQEDAESLMAFIDAVDRGNIGINFDPANMILYGIGDPVEALNVLRDRIMHVHMKDAVWAKRPREEWGEEVVLGTGDADIPRVVSKLRAGGYRGPLVIEREAGDDRLGDVREGIDLLESLL